MIDRWRPIGANFSQELTYEQQCSPTIYLILVYVHSVFFSSIQDQFFMNIR